MHGPLQDPEGVQPQVQRPRGALPREVGRGPRAVPCVLARGGGAGAPRGDRAAEAGRDGGRLLHGVPLQGGAEPDHQARGRRVRGHRQPMLDAHRPHHTAGRQLHIRVWRHGDQGRGQEQRALLADDRPHGVAQPAHHGHQALPPGRPLYGVRRAEEHAGDLWGEEPGEEEAQRRALPDARQLGVDPPGHRWRLPPAAGAGDVVCHRRDALHIRGPRLGAAVQRPAHARLVHLGVVDPNNDGHPAIAASEFSHVPPWDAGLPPRRAQQLCAGRPLCLGPQRADLDRDCHRSREDATGTPGAHHDGL
mmetsp:Transcript_38929/g.92207  ORF Transcript_38929/g.92207 Transcript_38929/m.92207 type:complete len:306 (-) Transcript_38929:1601-2518(-)